jgi:hypothetical protein
MKCHKDFAAVYQDGIELLILSCLVRHQGDILQL